MDDRGDQEPLSLVERQHKSLRTGLRMTGKSTTNGREGQGAYKIWRPPPASLSLPLFRPRTSSPGRHGPGPGPAGPPPPAQPAGTAPEPPGGRPPAGGGAAPARAPPGARSRAGGSRRGRSPVARPAPPGP